MKKRLAALTALAILLICLSACRATEQEGFEPEAEKHSSNSSAYIVEPKGEDETVVSQTDTSKISGVFDFDIHPLPDGILPDLGVVQLLGVGDSAFELFLDLRLRFAEEIFADRLAGLGIMTRRVAPFPAPVAALADIALALCSAFCHILSHSFGTNNTPKEPGSRAESF